MKEGSGRREAGLLRAPYPDPYFQLGVVKGEKRTPRCAGEGKTGSLENCPGG